MLARSENERVLYWILVSHFVLNTADIYSIKLNCFFSAVFVSHSTDKKLIPRLQTDLSNHVGGAPTGARPPVAQT